MAVTVGNSPLRTHAFKKFGNKLRRNTTITRNPMRKLPRTSFNFADINEFAGSVGPRTNISTAVVNGFRNEYRTKANDVLNAYQGIAQRNKVSEERGAFGPKTVRRGGMKRRRGTKKHSRRMRRRHTRKN